MKIYSKIIILFTLFSTTVNFLQAQNRINQVLDNVSGANFTKISPFRLNQTATVVDNVFDENYKPIMLNIEPAALQQFNSQSNFLEMNLPISEKENLTLELYEANIFAENFKVVNSEGKEVIFEKGLHYRGRIKGNNQSICAISIMNNEISGFISDNTGNQNLKKLQNGTYALYYENKLLEKTGFICGIIEEPFSLPPTPNAVAAGVGCKIVDIYIEADNQMFLNNGSSITNTSTLATNNFNQVATLYTNENIEIRLTSIKVWDTADPYPGTNPSIVLNLFKSVLGTSFTGNLAHLFSGRNLAGIAYLNVLNNKSSAHGVSSMTFGGYYNGAFSTSPIGEITHEIGHNMGSPHTHNCAAWVGGGIDNCAGTYGAIYAEGSCTPANPPAGGGTIMSYCHLLSAIGTNYANGFGTQPGDLIRAKVLAATGLASSAPASPSTTGASRCDAGTLNLSASACTGGTIKWYNAATGGTSIGTGATFTTPSISTTTNYYASCTIGSCESSTRTLTAASIVPIAAPTGSSVSRCGAGFVTLIASGCSGGTIRWYGSLTGTAILSSTAGYVLSVSTTTSFYASCTIGSCVSPRTTFTATINTLPAAPVITNASRCGAGVLNLSATCPTGEVPNWYRFIVMDSPILVATGNTYSPTLSASVSYSVICTNALCSISGTATATVNPVIAPISESRESCGTGTVTLNATGCTGGSIKWYGSLTSTVILSTAIAYSPTVSVTTNFYATCTVGPCESVRVAYPVTVTVAPTPPVITNVSRCGAGSVTLSATCIAGTGTSWWSEDYISLLGTGSTFTTSVTSTTNYAVFCSSGIAFCYAVGMATATINPIPATPTVSPITIASGMATNLTASGTCSGTIQWFSNSTTTTLLASGVTYTSPTLTTNTSYDYACNSGLCSSPRGSVLVNVSACPPTIIMLSPTHNLITGTNPYETSGVFSATNKLTGGNTKYDSASGILLNPGFEVSGGATFSAIIDGCGGSY